MKYILLLTILFFPSCGTDPGPVTFHLPKGEKGDTGPQGEMGPTGPAYPFISGITLRKEKNKCYIVFPNGGWAYVGNTCEVE